MKNDMINNEQNDLLALLPSVPHNAQPQTAPGVWEIALENFQGKGSVLVAGAGHGGMSYLLDKAGYSVASIDLYSDQFVIDGLSCSSADLLNPLDFSDEAFDYVLATEVMEHLENPWLFLHESFGYSVGGGL